MEDLKERWAKIIDDALAVDDAENFSVADVEATLLKIREREQEIAAEKDKCDQSVRYYQQFIDNAKENFAADTKRARDEIELLKVRLKRYCDAHPPVGRKTHKFAGGSFGYNRAQTKFYFNGSEVNADNKDMAQFCVDSGMTQFIKVKEYLDWASLKKNLDFDDPNVVVLADTGEVVDGLRAEKIFSVKTLGGAP